MENIEFFAQFHKMATDLFNKMEDATNDMERETLRRQWCDVDNAFKALSGVTLYEANKYFLKGER